MQYEAYRRPFKIRPSRLSQSPFFMGYWRFCVPYRSICFCPLWLPSLLILEASRTHTDTPHSGGLLWTRNRSVVEASTDNTQHSQQASMGISTSNPRKRAAADRATTGIGTGQDTEV
jgi:hypothetical protein